MRSAFAAALCIGLACGAAQAQDATYPFEDSAPAATAPAKRAKPAVKPAAAPAAKPVEQRGGSNSYATSCGQAA